MSNHNNNMNTTTKIILAIKPDNCEQMNNNKYIKGERHVKSEGELNLTPTITIRIKIELNSYAVIRTLKEKGNHYNCKLTGEKCDNEM